MMKLTKSSRVFRRATAFVLAAALTLSAPVATQASAASKKKVPSLSVKKKTLYYNQAGKKSFTLKVKKNKVKKIVKTKWTTSKKSTVGISAKKKTTVKVTAKKKGTATIKAKVTYKAGSKTKTKTLTCKVTSKKKTTPATKAPATDVPATDVPATDVPATDVPATDVPATDVPATDVPTSAPTTEPTAEPTETPAAVVAKVSNVSAIDPKEFNVTLSFENAVGEVTEDLIKGVKLEMKKGDITLTASYKALEESGSAIFAIDDTSKLNVKDRSADGTYDVTSSSANLVLPEKATTTYESAISALAVEGFVTTPVYNASGVFEKYEPVAGATVTILNNGKTATTDSYGYYRIATNSGKKTMRVEKDGLVTQTTAIDQVSVNRNSLTSENFVLATYDVKKVYLNIHAVNSLNEAINVAGATVVLKNKDGKKVYERELKTDTAGKAVIANHNGDVSYSANNVQPANSTDPVFLAKGEKYTLEIEKRLSKDNLNDVYKLYTGEVEIGGQYKHEVTAKVVKVLELPSMSITHSYSTDTTEYGLADNTPVYYTYQLFAESLKDGNNVAGALTLEDKTGVANEGSKLLATTGNIKNHSVSGDLVSLVQSNITAAPAGPNTTNNKMTLPTGKYYVLIRSYGTDATWVTPTATTAYAVVQVDVTEGAVASASIVLTKGCTREITTNVGLRAIENDTQMNAVSGGSLSVGTDLKVIEKTYAAAPAAAYKLVTPDKVVNANNDLYQRMTGDVLVPVDRSTYAAATLPVQYTDKKTFSAKNEYTHILGAANYTLKTSSNYSKADDWNFPANDIVNQQHTVDADSKWKLVKIKIKVKASDTALIGKASADIPKLAGIRVLDSANAVASSKTYATADQIVATAAIAGTAVAVNDEIEYAIPAADIALVDRGSYRIEATLAGCNAAKSDLTTVNGIEDLTSSITEAIVPSVSTDKTTLKGNVIIKKLDGTTYKADDSTHKVQIVLLSGSKIAGVGATNASGDYSIVDATSNGGKAKLGSGSYTLVARGYTAETFVKTVTLTEKEALTENLNLTDGATGTIKAKITNYNNNGIAGARVRAYDANYIKPDAGNWVSGTAGTIDDTGLIGQYEDSNVIGTAGQVYEEREVKGLSEGSYTLEFYGNSAYKFVNQTETLSGIGDKKYPEFQFNPVAEDAGSGKVRLTVKHPNITGGSYVVIAKTENGQIEDIKYCGHFAETNPSSTIAGKTSGSFTTLSVTSHQNYNIYVYDLTGHYVATTTKNVQSFAAEVTVAFDQATVD